MVRRNTRRKLIARLGYLAAFVLILTNIGSAEASSISGIVSTGAGGQPIAGAAVSLWAVSNVVGKAFTLASTTSAIDGAFTISNVICPANNPKTYITAIGGDAGNGDNSAIGLMTFTWNCNGLSNLPPIIVNELTTATTEVAFDQFIDPTGELIDARSAEQIGLDNSVKLLNTNLVDAFTGQPAVFLQGVSPTCSSTSPSPNCNPLEAINTFANILAACIESTGASSSECTSLLALTLTPPGSTTLWVAHRIARYPAANVGQLYALAGSGSPQGFLPALPTKPGSLAVMLNYTIPSLTNTDSFTVPIAIDALGNPWIAWTGSVNFASQPWLARLSPTGQVTFYKTEPTPTDGVAEAIAIDASSNVWVAGWVNRESISEFTSSGDALSPAAGYTGGGLDGVDDGVDALAFDLLGNLWAASEAGLNNGGDGSGSLSEFTSDGVPISPALGYLGGGLANPHSLAIAASSVWVGNWIADDISEFDLTGTPLSPSGGYNVGGQMRGAVAIDVNSNAWTLASSNLNGDAAYKIESAGGEVTVSPPYRVGGEATAIAVDGANNVWVNTLFCAQYACGLNGSSIVELNHSGKVISAPGGYLNPALNDNPFQYNALALDGSGDVWLSNLVQNGTVDNGSISELIGLAAPVKTPLIGPPQSP